MKKLIVVLIFVSTVGFGFAQETFYFPAVQKFSGVVYPDSVVADYYNGELVNISFALNYDMPRKVFVTPGIFENAKTFSPEFDDLETLYNRLTNASLICADVEIYAAQVSQREYRLFSVHFIDDDMWYQVYVDLPNSNVLD